MKEISRAERVFYLIAAAFAPCIPLFFLYSRNVAEGILFSYCLVFAAVLAVFSVILYVLLSLAFKAPGAVLLFVAALWAVFWYVGSLHGLLLRFNEELPLSSVAAIFLGIVVAAAVVVLAYVKLPKAVGSVAALMLCLLFAFNFLPAAYTGLTARTALAASSGTGPYEIKSSFTVDSNLPSPNIYWLHMDSMIGFSSFERYFDDPQDELKNTLKKYGFVINETAELGGGNTVITMPMLMSPTFYDSFLSSITKEYAYLTRTKRHNKIMAELRKQGVNLQNDIYPEMELLKAFSDAGYTITGNKEVITLSAASNVLNDGKNITVIDTSRRDTEKKFAQLGIFKELVVEASALKIFETSINSYFEEKKSSAETKNAGAENKTEKIPAYESVVDRYKIAGSGSSAQMAEQVRAAKYATEMEQPFFLYLGDSTVHCKTYSNTIGRVFDVDENGNKIDLKKIQENDRDHNIFDLSRYYVGQYRYGVKQLLAKLEVIIENDPDALIIVQADHGIHGLGPVGADYFNEKTFEEQGYSIEDMQNFNKNVISAVRIPAKYGKLDQPLEPLDISRYLVNHYVGKNNYDYLTYKEQS